MPDQIWQGEVKKGADGLVRKVLLQYKLPEEKVFRTVDRPIHGIAVVSIKIQRKMIRKVLTYVFTRFRLIN